MLLSKQEAHSLKGFDISQQVKGDNSGCAGYNEDAGPSLRHKQIQTCLNSIIVCGAQSCNRKSIVIMENHTQWFTRFHMK